MTIVYKLICWYIVLVLGPLVIKCSRLKCNLQKSLYITKIYGHLKLFFLYLVIEIICDLLMHLPCMFFTFGTHFLHLIFRHKFFMTGFTNLIDWCSPGNLLWYKCLLTRLEVFLCGQKGEFQLILKCNHLPHERKDKGSYKNRPYSFLKRGFNPKIYVTYNVSACQERNILVL